MRRFFSLLGWIIKIAIVSAAGAWLYLYPGTLEINWQGRTIDTSTSFAAVVAFVVLVFFAVLYHGWRTVLGWPRAWRKQRRIRAQEIGYKALNKGLLAVAAGDNMTAAKNARKAVAMLPDIALSHLLAAQSAQLNNDEVAADTHLAILTQMPEGQVFGMRGQLGRAMQRNDTTEALRLSRLAYAQQPHQPWVIDTALQLEARQHNWLQAEKILRQAIRLGGPEIENYQKNLAAVLVALSDNYLAARDTEAALDVARQARKLLPGWTPAAVRVAKLWQGKAYRRRAQKALIAAWEITPHPELVTAWLEVSGAAKALDRTGSVEKLTSSNPDNYESSFAMAQAYVTAGLWGVARKHASQAIEYRPDRAAYRLMADIEENDTRNARKIREWLDKASDAPLEPQWQDIVTGEIFAEWQVLNRQNDFNTIIWQTPFTRIPDTVRVGNLSETLIEPQK
jgi:HemY protein